MTSQLCKTCQNIPPQFFSAENDNPDGLGGEPCIPLMPLNPMRRSASAGCPLCAALTACADFNWLPDGALEHRVVYLRRSVIDPQNSVGLFVGGDDVSSSSFFRIPPNWAAITQPSQFQSVNDIDLIRTWISECTQNHTLCSEYQLPFLPTRLLDVQAFGDSSDIKLVSLEQLSVGHEYVALSHCWGSESKRPLTTEKDTLEGRKHRIAYESLSRTFRDAVEITRGIGQRYLWIDSLCIIQNDEKDWEKEAATMPRVYGGAVVTLAALSSKDGTEGCRVNSTAASQLPRHLDFDVGNLQIRLFEGKAKFWHDEFGDRPRDLDRQDANPLRTRAWALQERELSTRIVHFSENMLLWECRTEKGSSEIPWKALIVAPDDTLPLPMRNKLKDGGEMVLRDRWYMIIEGYTARFLTKESDKLLALSGLASKFFQDHFSSAHYLAGLWSIHMPFALLWRTVDGQKSRCFRSFRAPTWSWASLDGAVTFESQRLTDADDSSDEATASSLVCARLVEDFDHPIDPSEFSDVLQKSLLVNGLLRKVRLEHENSTHVNGMSLGSDGLQAILSDEGTVIGVMYPDIMTELQPEDQLLCLCVREEHYWSLTTIPGALYGQACWTKEGFNDLSAMMGLILVRDKSLPNAYRRVGLARWVKKQIFEDCQPTTITLF